MSLFYSTRCHILMSRFRHMWVLNDHHGELVVNSFCQRSIIHKCVYIWQTAAFEAAFGPQLLTATHSCRIKSPNYTFLHSYAIIPLSGALLLLKNNPVREVDTWCWRKGWYLQMRTSTSSSLPRVWSSTLSETSQISSYQTFPAFSVGTLEISWQPQRNQSLQVLTGLSHGHRGRKKRPINASHC